MVSNLVVNKPFGESEVYKHIPRTFEMEWVNKSVGGWEEDNERLVILETRGGRDDFYIVNCKEVCSILWKWEMDY